MKSYPSLTVLRTRTCPAVSLLPRFTFFDGSGPDVEVVDADVVVEDDVDAEVVVFSLPEMENLHYLMCTLYPISVPQKFH